jgi:predicted Zn-dependent protease
VPAQFDQTDNSTPEDRVGAALTALAIARRSSDLECAGYLQTDSSAIGIMNSAGLFAYHRSSGNDYSLTVRTKDGTGSGWAAADHPDWTKLDFERVSARALEKARASRNPVAIEPGRYTVILEPAAVGNLVPLLGQALTARTADEGRSAFAKAGGGNRVGEPVVDSRVTLLSDPQDLQLLGRPFDNEGMPLSRQVWIENGVLKRLAYTRFWAQKQGKQPTGGAGGGGGGGGGGGAGGLKLAGGTVSVEDMIKSTERGVLLTHLFYLRQVDPRTVVYTGLTRDGTFLIEDGKIARPIKNFRFNESPLFLLNNLEAIGPSERLGNAAMPAIKARDFNFTSLSDAV